MPDQDQNNPVNQQQPPQDMPVGPQNAVQEIVKTLKDANNVLIIISHKNRSCKINFY